MKTSEILNFMARQDIPFSRKNFMAAVGTVGFWDAFTCLEIKYTAWKYFLPLQQIKKALVFDAALGLDSFSLSKHVEKLVTVAFDRSEALFLASRLEGYENIDIVTAPSPLDLPFDKGEFDLIVLRDFDTLKLSILKTTNKKYFQVMMRLLNRGGLLLCGVNHHAFSSIKVSKYDTIRAKTDRISLSLYIRNLGRKHSHKIKDVLYCYPNQYRTNEMVPWSLLPKREIDKTSIKKIIKDLIIRYRLPILSRSSLYIIANEAAPEQGSFLSEMLADIANQRGLQQQDLTLIKIIIASPNTMICIIDDGTSGSIARIPMDEASAIRTNHQYKILINLQNRKGLNKSVFPHQYPPFSINGQKIFVEKRMDGFFIRNVVNSFTEYEESAVNWIIDFHRRTCNDTILNATKFYELVGLPIHKLIGYVKDERETIRLKSLEEMLFNRLVDLPIPLVCHHGDYKIENILFSKNSFSITGVIDWDLAQLKGFPVLDLLYLLAYSHKLKNPNLEISFIMVSKFIESKISVREQVFLDSYFEALGLDSKTLPVFATMAWLYHVTFRYGDLMKLWPSWYEQNISQVLVSLESSLQLFGN